jgi:hypothetical protein
VKSPTSAMRLSPSSSWCVPALFRLMRGKVLKAQAARFPRGARCRASMGSRPQAVPHAAGKPYSPPLKRALLVPEPIGLCSLVSSNNGDGIAGC